MQAKAIIFVVLCLCVVLVQHRLKKNFEQAHGDEEEDFQLDGNKLEDVDEPDGNDQQTDEEIQDSQEILPVNEYEQPEYFNSTSFEYQPEEETIEMTTCKTSPEDEIPKLNSSGIQLIEFQTDGVKLQMSPVEIKATRNREVTGFNDQGEEVTILQTTVTATASIVAEYQYQYGMKHFLSVGIWVAIFLITIITAFESYQNLKAQQQKQQKRGYPRKSYTNNRHTVIDIDEGA